MTDTQERVFIALEAFTHEVCMHQMKKQTSSMSLATFPSSQAKKENPKKKPFKILVYF
jgi:hypothetical protein